MRIRLAAITLVAIAASIVPSAAQKANATFGLLDCVVEAWHTLHHRLAEKALTCTFTSANPKVAPETYIGVITKLGLDVGPTPKAVLRWRVLAPTGNVYAPGVLAGDYSGVGAEATVGVGGWCQSSGWRIQQDLYVAATQCPGADWPECGSRCGQFPTSRRQIELLRAQRDGMWFNAGGTSPRCQWLYR